MALTQQHSRDTPAQGVVEAHSPVVHVARLNLHAVEVQSLHEEPGKGAEEEVVQEDGDRGAHQLQAGRVGSRHRPRPTSDPHAQHLFPTFDP